MTTTAATVPNPIGIPPEPDTWSIGPPRLLAAGYDAMRPYDRVAPRLLSRDQLIRDTTTVGLLGRGGAAFPVAAKLRAMPRRRAATVVVNGSESEPASYKDRILMRHSPHLVLDGALVVAHALRARRVLVAVNDEPAAAALHHAIGHRSDARSVRVAGTGGRFAGGEARAVLRALGGGPAVAPGRRVLPSDRGYRGTPTFLSNVETFAQIGLLAALGPRAYAGTGIAAEPGTTVLTVTGAVGRPGVIEVPHGTPLSVLLCEVGAAPGAAILLGGYHGSWWTGDPAVPLSRPILAAAGATLGAGVVCVLGPETCPLAELAHVAGYLADESAGQCGPCMFGLPTLAHDLRRAVGGHRSAASDLRRRLAVVPGRGACAHPDGTARFVESGMRAFVADIERHRTVGGCGRPLRGHLTVSPTWQGATR
jgi:NADH:ubiquinone oxidoreductase subunit F (NADH-binding)